ncbi:MAG: alpha/beta hydrolase [Anaerolineae bacterium]|nr:alpha/beta hydrolase [Anaerolineae bacterium]
MKKWIIRIIATVAGLLVLISGGGAAFALATSAGPTEEGAQGLESTSAVAVADQGHWITFTPTGTRPTTGLIFYPGGLVRAESYAPTMRAIAEQGYFVAIVRMPLNLAVTSPDSASDVQALFYEIEHWAVGGHSLGGAMAARYAYAHPGAVDGLLLYAAWPAETDNLSASGLAVTSIYGTLDGLASVEEIDASRPLLPADTTYVAIEGGNHAGFGHYGPQRGDNPASISLDEQQAQIVEASVALLGSLMAP